MQQSVDSRPAVTRAPESLGALATLAVGGLFFTVLLVLVLTRWRPLRDLDQDVSLRLNEAVAASGPADRSGPRSGGPAPVAPGGLPGRRHGRGGRRLVSRVLVPRDRPEAGSPVEQLPAMASFPSGHAAAAMTLYGAIALIVFTHVHGRWRALLLAPPALLGLLIAASRLYRGVHYPTDVLTSALLSATWLTVTYRLVLHRPDGGHPTSARPAEERPAAPGS